MSATVVDDLVSWTLLFIVFQQNAAFGSDATSTRALGSNLAGVAGFFVVTLTVGWVGMVTWSSLAGVAHLRISPGHALTTGCPRA